MHTHIIFHLNKQPILFYESRAVNNTLSLQMLSMLPAMAANLVKEIMSEVIFFLLVASE